MSRLRIPIYFDYASTLCYIAWRIVTPLEDELGFEALWKGVPIAARDFRAKPGRVLGERERQKVLFVAAETGIRVAPPPSWIDSTAALKDRKSRATRACSRRITTRCFARRSMMAPISRTPGARRDRGARRNRSSEVSRGARQRRDGRAHRRAQARGRRVFRAWLSDVHPRRFSDDRHTADRIDAAVARAASSASAPRNRKRKLTFARRSP